MYYPIDITNPGNFLLYVGMISVVFVAVRLAFRR